MVQLLGWVAEATVKAALRRLVDREPAAA